MYCRGRSAPVPGKKSGPAGKESGIDEFLEKVPIYGDPVQNMVHCGAKIAFFSLIAHPS